MEKEITLNIAGMSCAACSASVEKVTRKLEGVKLCEVNLATNQAHIIYETEQVKLSDIKLKIQKAGFEPRELAEISREELRDEEMEEQSSEVTWPRPPCWHAFHHTEHQWRTGWHSYRLHASVSSHKNGVHFMGLLHTMGGHEHRKNGFSGIKVVLHQGGMDPSPRIGGAPP